jgi:predicted nuclease with TOPRIM domain
LRRSSVDLTKKLETLKNEANNPILKQASKELELNTLNSKVANAKNLYRTIVDKYNKAEQALQSGDGTVINNYVSEVTNQEKQFEKFAQYYEDLLKNPKVEAWLGENEDGKSIRANVKTIQDTKTQMDLILKKFDTLKSSFESGSIKMSK